MKNQTENMEQEVVQEEIETKKILFWNVSVEKIEKAKKIGLKIVKGLAVVVVVAAGACYVAAKSQSSDPDGESTDSEESDSSDESSRHNRQSNSRRHYRRKNAANKKINTSYRHYFCTKLHHCLGFVVHDCLLLSKYNLFIIEAVNPAKKKSPMHFLHRAFS